MKISLLQFRSEIGNVENNMNTMESMVQEAMNTETPPDVLVLPELWSTAFFPTPIEAYADTDANGYWGRKKISALAKKYSVNIVGGSVATQHDSYIGNNAYIFDRNGELIAEYTKTHLFSFSGEDNHFKSGDKLVTFELDGCKCGILICYDIRFPEAARTLALQGINVLFLPAAWPLKRSYHWNTLIRARAIENQMYIAAVNSCGESAIIDPWGEDVAAATKGSREPAIISGEIQLEKIQEIRNTINVFRDRKKEIYKI